MEVGRLFEYRTRSVQLLAEHPTCWAIDQVFQQKVFMQSSKVNLCLETHNIICIRWEKTPLRIIYYCVENKPQNIEI